MQVQYCDFLTVLRLSLLTNRSMCPTPNIHIESLSVAFLVVPGCGEGEVFLNLNLSPSIWTLATSFPCVNDLNIIAPRVI